MKIWQIIVLVLTVSNTVQSQTRLVVNTTCLELAWPSNQQFRLNCRRYDYHCLLDETFTQEFEVCRVWKWIPEGHCAYFNTYGEGNIDGRPCPKSASLICPTQQYSSAESILHTACYIYVKKITSTIKPRTSFRILEVPSNQTSGGENSTYFPINEINNEVGSTVRALWIVFGIVVSVIFIAVISFFFVRLKWFQQHRQGIKEDDETLTPMFNINAMTGNSRSLSPFSEKGEEEFANACPDSLKTNEEEEETDVSDDKGNKSLLTDVLKKETDEEEGAAEMSPWSNSDLEKIYNEKEDTKESTDVFDDTVESLLRKAPPADKEDEEICNELHNLLAEEGKKLSQEVMSAIITKEAGKSVKELVADKTVQKMLKEIVPEECLGFLKNSLECEESIHISYCLVKIYLKEQSPKSGWDNPVRGKDISIGDDVARLYRIYSIAQKISNPGTVSVEGYVKLLNIMVKALTRLDPDAKFKKEFKAVTKKLSNENREILIEYVIAGCAVALLYLLIK